MIEHLTQRQLEDYCLQQLRVAELLSVSEHLGECEACRRRAELGVNGDAAFFGLRSEVFGDEPETISPHAARRHLSAEQAALYVDGDLSGEALQNVVDHLTVCEHCASAVDDLREFSDKIAPSLGREYQPAAGHSPTGGRWRRAVASLGAVFGAFPRPAFGAAMAILLLASAGWLVWRTPQEAEPNREVAASHAPSPETAPAVASPTRAEQAIATPERAALPQPTPVAVVAQLNDGGGRLTLDERGELSGAEGLPPAYRGILKEALNGRRIGRSRQLEGLARPPSSLMSSDSRGGEFSVIEPAGNVLLTDRPTFRWTPMEGAAGYVVEVYDGNFNPVATSAQLTGHSWTAPRPLPRGQVYSWQVKAIKNGQEEVTSPRPPAPQARFRVLDRPKANELLRARRAYQSSHLALGLMYAEAGLLKEAEQELRLLRKANPDSELARRLLRQVQSLQRRGE